MRNVRPNGVTCDGARQVLDDKRQLCSEKCFEMFLINFTIFPYNQPLDFFLINLLFLLTLDEFGAASKVQVSKLKKFINLVKGFWIFGIVGYFEKFPS